MSPSLTQIDFDMGQGQGQFNVEMRAFQDAEFQVPISDDMEILVPDPINVQVSTDPGMVVQFRECWATPRSFNKNIR